MGQPGADLGELSQDRPELGLVPHQAILGLSGLDRPLPVEDATIDVRGLRLVRQGHADVGIEGPTGCREEPEPLAFTDGQGRIPNEGIALFERLREHRPGAGIVAR